MYTNGIRPIQVDGSTVVTVGTGTSPQWYTASVTAGQSIVVNGAGQAGTHSFIYDGYVDGEVDIDSTQHQDTVLDTTMKSTTTN